MEDEKLVRMAPLPVLLSIDNIENLAEDIRRVRLSRRKTVDWLIDILYAWYALGGIVLDWNGEPVEINDQLVDLIYGEDASCTWVSTIKEITPGSRKRAPRSGMALRLGLYNVGLQIAERLGFLSR